MIEEIQATFPDKTRIIVKELKEKLQDIYIKYGILATAKTSDLLLFGYRMRQIIITVDGKRLNGTELTIN